MRKRWRRVRALLFVVGLGIGLGLGLGVSWGLLPRMPRFADLSQLQIGYKEEFILMTSVAYAQDGDLEQARERLSLLGEPDIPQRVASIAEEAIAAGASPQTRRGLARLAFALGEKSSAIMAYVATPIRTATSTSAPPPATASAPPSPSLVSTPTSSATPTQRVTREVSTSTPQDLRPRPLGTGAAAGYVLTAAQRLVGEANVLPGHILINVLSSDGEGLPGIRIRIEWNEGSDTVMTGLHPDKEAGYADFEMVSGRTYAVFVAGIQSEKATGLAATSAGSNAGAHPESWQVEFSRLP